MTFSLLRRIARIPLAIRVATTWNSVHAMSVSGRYEDALALVETLPQREGTRIHWQVKRIQLRHLLEQDEWVADAAPRAIQAIGADREYSLAERAYFFAYVSYLLSLSKKQLTNRTHFAESNEIDYGKIRLDRIAPMWKRAFPMTNHPEWDERFGKALD